METQKKATRRGIWSQATPHFGGTASHRYENGSCVYCGRPINWVSRAAIAKATGA